MKPIRWNPLEEINLLQNRMNRLFDSALHEWWGTDSTTGWMPAADVYESDQELVVRLDLPGIDPKKVDARVENDVLTVRGERPAEDDYGKEAFLRLERPHGAFSRSFNLAVPVDAEKIRAAFSDGVLTITLPKTESAKPRRIQIAAAAAA